MKTNISKHQQKIISLIGKGYRLFYQNDFPKSNKWYLNKHFKGGKQDSLHLLKSSCDKLVSHALIKYNKTYANAHQYFNLTKLGKIYLEFLKQTDNKK